MASVRKAKTGTDRRNLSPVAKKFVRCEITGRWKQFSGLFVLSFIGAVIEMTGIGLVFPLLIILVAPDRLEAIPELMAVIDESGLSKANLPLVLIGLIAAVMVGKNGYMLFFNWLTARALARWKTELSQRLIRTYLFSDYAIHLAKTSSEIIRNMSLSAAIFDQFVTGMINLVVNGLILVALSSLLIFVLPSETRFGLLLVGGTALTLYFVMRQPFARIGRDLNELFQRRQAIMRQSIGMIRETKLTARENYFLEVFGEIERRNFQRQATSRFMGVIPPLATESAVILSVLAIITHLLFFSGQGDLGLALLGLMAATFFRLTPVINRLLTSLQLINVSRNSVEIVAQELNELEPNIYRPEIEPEPLPFESDIQLEKIGYSYPGSEVRAVRGVSLEIKKGEMIGITGPSGGGKSTLVALFMGLVPPTEGRILSDGVPLDSAAKVRAWQRHIGFVPQSVFLMEDSIARNVAFAADEIDEERVWRALDMVQMRDFVEGLPEGINSHVGEDGSRLSGGQRQRLGIARVLYDDPQVLIFDEATSALDAATEQAFTDSLLNLRGERTLVLIAHRLSTLRDCDRIAMMENGGIIDVAPFGTLQARCTQFANLVELSRLEKDE